MQARMTRLLSENDTLLRELESTEAASGGAMAGAGGGAVAAAAAAVAAAAKVAAASTAITALEAAALPAEPDDSIKTQQRGAADE